MKQRYHSFRRENGIYYSLDTLTRKRNSLNTSNAEEARRFLNALNEACKQPAGDFKLEQSTYSPYNHGCQRWVIARSDSSSSGRKSTSGGRTGPPARPMISIIAFIAETS